MSDKISKTPTVTVQQFKEDFKKSFIEISPKLERRDRMQIALNLDVALETVNRYIDGGLSDIRRLELAESILSEAKEVIRTKAQSPATA